MIAAKTFHDYSEPCGGGGRLFSKMWERCFTQR